MLDFDLTPRRLSQAVMDENTNSALGVGQQEMQESNQDGDSSLDSSIETFLEYHFEVSEISTDPMSWFHESDLESMGSDEEGWFSSLESYEDSQEYVFLPAKDWIPTDDSSDDAPLANGKGKTMPLVFDDEESVVDNSTNFVFSPKTSHPEVKDTIHTSEVLMGELVQVDQASQSQTLTGSRKLQEARDSVVNRTTALQRTLGKAYRIAPIRQGATFASFLGRGAFSAGNNVAAAVKNQWNNGIVRSLRDNLAEAGDMVWEGLDALPQPEDSMGVRHRRRLF